MTAWVIVVVDCCNCRRCRSQSFMFFPVALKRLLEFAPPAPFFEPAWQYRPMIWVVWPKNLSDVNSHRLRISQTVKKHLIRSTYTYFVSNELFFNISWRKKISILALVNHTTIVFLTHIIHAQMPRSEG